MSLKIDDESNSIKADTKTAEKLIINNAGERENIIIVAVIINAVEPSNDLLKTFVVPYFIPIMAAAESDRLITNKDMIATFSLNKYTVTPAPINTQDAPDNPSYSLGRVIIPNKL